MLMTRTVLKVGNSLGVTFPESFVSEHKLKAGDKVAITKQNGVITYSATLPIETEYETVTDKTFFDLVKEVDLKYKKTLDELANLP